MIRKIHLDFHTHPDTRGIGSEFDTEAFAQMLADAHVNALATPGKCHFGNIYFDTRVGKPHPQLARPDLFPATVAACAKRGLKVQAYWSLGLDSAAAQEHPSWRQRHQDGSFGCWGHCLHMCFASPYIDEMVIPEVLEAMDRCPGLAGFWFDICLYVDGAFYSEWFERAARERLGDSVDDVTERWRLARQIICQRCQQIDAAIKDKLPEAENYFNSLVVPGEPLNIPLQAYQEVENPILFGGPEKMTTHVRWLRSLDARVIGLVSRFQGPWSDPGTLRTEDQMRFDVARTVALGCHISMGDHRRPDGTLEPEVYRRLAPIYEELERLEPWLDGTKPCQEVTLLAPLICGSGQGVIVPDMSLLTLQAARMLEEIGIQFDIVSVEDDLPKTDLVIWPGEKTGSYEFLPRLEQHVTDGGALLAMHAAAVESVVAEHLFGVKVLPWRNDQPAPSDDDNGTNTNGCGHVAAPTTAADGCDSAGVFLRLREEYGGQSFSHIISQPSRVIQALPGTDVLGDRFSPISEKPSFPSNIVSGPMIVQRGRVIYSAAPLFAEDSETGTPVIREIITSLCSRLLGRFLVRHSGGTSVAAHLHRSKPGYTLHLVHWAMDRWGRQLNPTAVFPRLGSIKVELAISEPVQQITLEPAGTSVEFDQQNASVRFSVPEMRVWQVIGIALIKEERTSPG